jgi:hypothetical protein
MALGYMLVWGLRWQPEGFQRQETQKKEKEAVVTV